ncbi:hypothetical protein HY844_00325 [Candidatus Berkelbacteria bacterium]|nr:hypothetical protein [Candidatus Berkelbacteria bacterium]
MTIIDTINILTVLLLIGSLIAVCLLIALLFKANKAVSAIENLSENFGKFVRDIVASMVNIQTVTTAVHEIVEKFTDHKNTKKKSK